MSEVRLINANGLIKIVNNEKAPDWWKEIIRGWIKKQPTVDAVPVVRCRECKHRGTRKCKLFRTEFNEWSIEFESIDLTQPDWFCADGDNSDN